MPAFRPQGAAGVVASILLAACAVQPDRAWSTEYGSSSTMHDAEVTGFASAAIDRGQIPGAVVMVWQRDRLLTFEALGRRDLASGQAMTKDTIFRIASMTKPVTAVAMMILFEEGKWDLDDPVSKYVPEFASLDVLAADGTLRPAARAMTMRDLMRHTAGFGYVLQIDPVDEIYARENVLDPNSTLSEMVGKLSRMPLSYQPGSRWAYSIGVDVQGYIVEKLSGQKLDDFFRARVFKPLGMADSGFYVPASKRGRLATSYARMPGAGLHTVPDESDPTRPPALLSGGSGMFSTASDYMRFSRMLLGGGAIDGVRILRPETVRLIRTNQLSGGMTIGLKPSPEGEVWAGQGFGFGVAIYTDPRAARLPVGDGTYWWAGAYGTWFSIDPRNEVIAIVMTQTFGAGAGEGFPDLRQESFGAIYRALPRTPAH